MFLTVLIFFFFWLFKLMIMNYIAKLSYCWRLVVCWVTEALWDDKVCRCGFSEDDNFNMALYFLQYNS